MCKRKTVSSYVTFSLGDLELEEGHWVCSGTERYSICCSYLLINNTRRVCGGELRGQKSNKYECKRACSKQKGSFTVFGNDNFLCHYH